MFNFNLYNNETKCLTCTETQNTNNELNLKLQELHYMRAYHTHTVV